MPQQDFNSAERQAIMRAREMYRRASPPPNGNPQFHKQPIPDTESPKPERKAFSMPDQQHKKSSFLSFFDGDMKLIIAMMLLLSGDGGDTMLLLALIYIMM